MFKRQLLLILALIIVAIPASAGQTKSILPVSYENWTSWQRAYLDALTETILATEDQSPAFVISHQRTRKPLSIVWVPNSEYPGEYVRGTDVDLLFVKTRPVRGIDTSAFNTVVAHELCHAMLDHSSYAFLPSSLEEGLCDAYGREVAKENISEELVLEVPRHNRSRAGKALERYALAFADPDTALPLREAIWQDDPTRSCALAWCPRYDELAWHMIKYVRAVSDQTGINKRTAFYRTSVVLKRLADELESKRLLRFEEIWTALNSEFPSVRVDGQSILVYFETQTIYTTLSPGRHYGVEALGNWRTSNGSIRSAPMNITQFKINGVDVGEKNFYITAPFPRPVPSDMVYAQLRNAHGEILCLDELNCQPATAIQIQSGVGYGFISRYLDPGLYELRLLDREGRVIARTYFMQLPFYPSLKAETDGLFVWHIGENGEINDRPRMIPGCPVRFEAPGVTQIICPPGVEQINLGGGQIFDIKSQSVRILRPYGSRVWPVLQLDPSVVIISVGESTSTFEVMDTNPASTSPPPLEIDVFPDSGHIDRDWAQVSDIAESDGRRFLEFTATPNFQYGTGERRCKVCIASRFGLRSVCADVIYNPR